jgi:hypothetical protein
MIAASVDKNRKIGFYSLCSPQLKGLGVFQASSEAGRGVPEGRGQPVFVE